MSHLTQDKSYSFIIQIDGIKLTINTRAALASLNPLIIDKNIAEIARGWGVFGEREGRHPTP